MWWETLPTLAVIGVCFTGIPIWVYGCNKLFLKNPYKRSVITYDDAHHYLRDIRISGVNSAYKQIGLENLSLEEKDSKSAVL